MHACDKVHQTRGLTYIIGDANTYSHFENSQLEGSSIGDLPWVSPQLQCILMSSLGPEARFSSNKLRAESPVPCPASCLGTAGLSDALLCSV